MLHMLSKPFIGHSSNVFLVFSLQNVGEQGHMALLGHSLAAYISVLDRERLRKLTTRILSDTTLWLCRLFRLVYRFPSSPEPS